MWSLGAYERITANTMPLDSEVEQSLKTAQCLRLALQRTDRWPGMDGGTEGGCEGDG